ncbi:unnamed protein product [Cylicocyclus nassatus]|uniref:Methyltransferase domain-containing protein n=1 Tax=Cylicocyclus nassatus TaxID=53992 RepID=A0AA36DTX2_CYLNA|nr:unnamed protein product [Cylicocyclus nassatus]
MLKLYEEQATSRRKYLQMVREQTSSLNYMALYNNLAPEAYCPMLVRVGTTSDGGKRICNPFRIPYGSIVLSYGINTDVTFEEELQRITMSCCTIFGYDSEQNSKTKYLYSRIPNTHLRKARIANFDYEANDTYTMKTLMKIDNVTAVEILKIDLENTEHKVLPQFLDSYRPRQIMVEIHGRNTSQVAILLQKISLHGYWLFSHEINGGYHKLCEYSFIHESAFDRYKAIPMAKYLD